MATSKEKTAPTQRAEGGKYELTDETKTLADGTVVHRIRALMKFETRKPDYPYGVEYLVNQGDLGGWVESEANLSHKGSCWVADEAIVCGHAKVKDCAVVTDHASVRDFAVVYGNAMITEYASVSGTAEVGGFGYVRIQGNAHVAECARVVGRTGTKTVVGDCAIVSGCAYVENAGVFGTAKIDEFAFVSIDSAITPEGQQGLIKLDQGHITDHARITKMSDLVSIRNFWSSGNPILYLPQMGVWTVGCFRGTGEQLIAKAYKDGKIKGKCYKLTVKYVEKVLKLLAKAGGAV